MARRNSGQRNWEYTTTYFHSSFKGGGCGTGGGHYVFPRLFLMSSVSLLVLFSIVVVCPLVFFCPLCSPLFCLQVFLMATTAGVGVSLFFFFLLPLLRHTDAHCCLCAVCICCFGSPFPEYWILTPVCSAGSPDNTGNYRSAASSPASNSVPNG